MGFALASNVVVRDGMRPDAPPARTNSTPPSGGCRIFRKAEDPSAQYPDTLALVGRAAILSCLMGDVASRAVGVSAAEPALAAAVWEPFYENDLGVTTYRHAGPSGTWFIKVAPAEIEGLHDEAARMRWAGQHLPVPEIRGMGKTRDGGTWLLTAALPGDDATRTPLRSEPRRLVAALARGLRRIHETPVAGCPFMFRLEESLAVASNRVRNGLVTQQDLHRDHAQLSPQAALERLLRDRPTSEELVVCHCDYCLPNVLIADGAATGFVDLGGLAVADRWCDLAVATWSITWNLGAEFEPAFLDAYGVEPDAGRMSYYRLLYDVVG